MTVLICKSDTMSRKVFTIREMAQSAGHIILREDDRNRAASRGVATEQSHFREERAPQELPATAAREGGKATIS